MTDRDHNPAKRRLHLPIVGVTNGPADDTGVNARGERKPPWLKVKLRSGPNYATLKGIMREPRPPHRVRGGDVPEHRRVLGGARGDLPDPGLEVHPPVRVLRRDDRQARPRRRGRARADRGRGARDGPALRRAHRGGARRPPRRRRRDLGRGDPGDPRGGPRLRRRGAAERLQGWRGRHRDRDRRPSPTCSPTTSRRCHACTSGSGRRSATSGRSRCCGSRSASGPDRSRSRT